MVETLDFPQYSGPFYRRTEYICRIADVLELGGLRRVLNQYGLDVVQHLPVDEHGARELYREPLYHLTVHGAEIEAMPITRYFTISEIRHICRRLKAGQVDLDDLADAIAAVKSEAAVVDQPGEDQQAAQDQP